MKRSPYRCFFHLFLISVYLYLCFCIFSRIAFNSDMANMVLEANDIVSGNIFLSDWILTGISFLTTDLLFFVFGAIMYGIHVNTYYAACTLMFATFSLTSLLLYKWHGARNNMVNILIWLSIGALPGASAAHFWCVHTAIWTYLFVICFFIEKMYQKNTISPDSNEYAYTIAAAICLALGTVGDAIIFIVGIPPVFVVCIFYWLTDLKRSRFSVKLGIAAIAGLLSGVLLEKLYFFVGGANKNSYLFRTAFKNMKDISSGFFLYMQGLLGLFDANFTGSPVLDPLTIISCLRFLIVIFGLYVVGKNVVLFFKRKNDDIVSVILSIGFITLSMVYIFTTLSIDIETTRYYAYVPILFCVLINRFFYTQQMGSFIISPRKRVIRYCVYILCGLLIGAIVGTKPLEKWSIKMANTPYENLGNVLLENGLENGFSGFWDASVTTVATNNRCKIRSVLSDGIRLVPHHWFCKKIWYHQYANFVVIRDGYGGISEENINLVLGQPDRRLNVDAFTVYVYDRDISKELQDTM